MNSSISKSAQAPKGHHSKTFGVHSHNAKVDRDMVCSVHLPATGLHTAIARPRKSAKKSPSVSKRSTVRVVELIEDIDTENFHVILEFRDITGRRRKLRMPRSELASSNGVAVRLLDKGLELDDETKKNLGELQHQFPQTQRRVTRNAGWHGTDCFVLPRRTLGRAQGPSFDVGSLNETSRRGLMEGSLRGWTAGLQEPLASSSYLVFAASLAFAAPVAALLDLEETAVFHVYGESNAGKTLMLRVAESVIGRASEHDLVRFNQTHAAFNDVMARYNGTLAPMNELKTVDATNLRKTLVTLAHVLTSGSGTNRSDYSKRDRDLRYKEWRLFGITNMEQSLHSLMNGKRDAGERARHIDLPVPPVSSGGIFDRTRRTGARRRRKATVLARQVEKVIERHYGAAFSLFVSQLIVHRERALRRFETNVDLFVERCVEVGDAWEKRFARKFGYAYAGGVLAIRLGVLPITRRQLVMACRKLYREARASFTTTAEQSSKFLGELLASVGDEQLFPNVPKGTSVQAEAASSCWGFRRFLPGLGDCVAVRHDQLRRLAGGDEVCKQVLADLVACGAYILGLGGKLTRSIEIKGLGRHRYVVLKAASLSTLADRRKAPV